MAFDESVKVYFLINSDQDEPAADTSAAYSYIKDHVDEKNIKWITESDGYDLIASDSLAKNDVFVLEKFGGALFDRLQTTKCLVVGPRCLTTCILECAQIPLGNSPVFTTAMRGLHVSATGLSVEEKEKVRKLVSWMGGYYFQNLGRSITHLIANTIQSTKYEHAALNNIAIMHSDWVHAVWERSSRENVAANDGDFDKYKLPVFYGANITCSGLDSEKKNEVMRLVNENGGIFNRAFRSQITDIVIIEKHNINSDKYKAAVSYKKDILIPEWIFDSVAKGYALPIKLYEVKNIKASTPTKSDHTVSDFQADCTQLSDISRISVADPRGRANSTVNESVCSVVAAKVNKDRNIMSEICPLEAKKAGTFLDGCCIYLCGFKTDEKEKLNRILNTSGATRYDEMNDNITHIIVGQSYDNDLKALKKLGSLSTVFILKLEWLLQSIKLKQTASETLYRIELPVSGVEPDAPSPSSKKTLKSMNYSFKQPDVPRKRLNFNTKPDDISPAPATPDTGNFEETDLLAQYSQENLIQNDEQPQVPAPMAKLMKKETKLDTSKQQRPPVPVEQETECSNALSTLDYDNLDFLTGMSIYIDKDQFVDEFYSQMIYECESARGNVVNEKFRDVVDYAIVSFEKTVDPNEFPIKAKHIVNELWVEDSIKENRQVPIEYYHKPIPKKADAKPLEGMIIVVSIYTGLERDFIDSLAQLLGAELNKAFVKKETPLLICPNAEGSKYEGAIKWRFPVVTSSWLMECASNGRKLSFDEFLVGDSPADFPSPMRSIPIANKVDTPSGTPLVELNQLPRTDSEVGTVPDFTPLRNKRVSQLAGPSKRKSTSLEPPDSPHTPTATKPPFDMFENLDEFLAGIENDTERECLRECIIEMKNNQTPELERIKRFACTPVTKRIATPKGIPEFCTTPEFQKRMWEAFDRRWHLSVKKRKPDTPIDVVRNRVFRATFQKYGIAVDPDAVTPKSHKTFNSINTIDFDSISKSTAERMEVDEQPSKSSPAVKQLTDFIKNCEGRRQSLQTRKRNEEESAVNLQKFDSETFGGTEPMVGWRDPSEFTIARRSKPNGMQYEGVPKFTISCLEDSVKADVIEKIRRLRGEICENLNNFDFSCTHLLCEKPNRGEKMLGCISSGKWILNIDYIDECCRHGIFIDEELYEWGNPKASKSCEGLPPEEQIIANAAYRWRRKIMGDGGLNDGRVGAFDDFRVILNVAEKHKESLKNVIKAGGGTVIATSPPYAECDDALRATHCFVDVKKAPLKRIDHECLVEHGVRVLSQMYINAYLMNGSDTDPVKYDLHL